MTFAASENNVKFINDFLQYKLTLMGQTTAVGTTTTAHTASQDGPPTHTNHLSQFVA